MPCFKGFKPKQIFKNIIPINGQMINIEDLCLVINKNILVISDIHIGYEEALNKQGILIPRTQFKDIVKKLEKIIGKRKFRIIVINGDLKHEFGKISRQEWRQSLLLLDFLQRHCEKIVLIKGNHDTILGPIAKKKNLEVVENFRIGNILLLHGDKEKEIMKNIKTIIIGHEHPAISIQEGIRAERYKCFLFGKYKKKNLIVMPSFNPVIEGADVRKEKLLSPYIRNIREFRAVAIAESGEAFDFGKIGELNV